MNARIAVLVVVYKKAWQESASLASLALLPADLKAQLGLYIRDNSPSTRIRDSDWACLGFSSVWLDHDGANLPLGEVYRRFACAAAEPTILFLDDDSVIEERYIRHAQKILSNPNASRTVVLPKVLGHSGALFSPSRFGIFSGRHVLIDLAPGFHRDLVAIMSGMALPRDYARHLGRRAFATGSRLYAIDTMFMLEHAIQSNNTYVTNVCIAHGLSRHEYKSFGEHIRRTMLEANGIVWTTRLYRKPWLPFLLPYLLYWTTRRILDYWLKKGDVSHASEPA